MRIAKGLQQAVGTSSLTIAGKAFAFRLTHPGQKNNFLLSHTARLGISISFACEVSHVRSCSASPLVASKARFIANKHLK